MDLDFTDPFRTFNRYKNAAFRYNSLEVTKCAVWDEEATRIMTKYAKDLRRLQLKSCQFNPESLPFTDIFGPLEKLEYIELVEVGYEKSWIDSESLKMDHLKRLDMSDSSPEVSFNFMK